MITKKGASKNSFFKMAYMGLIRILFRFRSSVCVGGIATLFTLTTETESKILPKCIGNS